MRWWTQLRAELRAIFSDTPGEVWPYGVPTVANEPVTVERAIGLSAVWACVNLIAGSIASMPLILYRRLADGERVRAEEHPLYDVLKTRPNPVQSCVSFWAAMVTAELLRGNAFAQLTRDDDSRVRALWFVSPDRVSVEVLRTGRLRYRISAPTGAPQIVPDRDMLHIVGPMSPDGYTGRSVVSAFRETLGMGLAIERYGAEFFGNAATPRGILHTDRALSKEARARLKQSLEENHASAGQRHKTIILEEGLQFQAVGISHEDSQFIESRRFTTEEVARIFGVPVHMIGGDTKGSLTYSNAETRALDFLKFCLGPWLARIESAVNFACISPLERRAMYCEYLPDSLLSTDTKSRYDAYQIGVSGGWLTVDEVRRRENLPALPERVPAIG